MESKQDRYRRIVQLRKMATYMGQLYHALLCDSSVCTDDTCAQIKGNILHINKCPFASSRDKSTCNFTGCKTTYILIDHLYKHGRVKRSILPQCFHCDYDDKNSFISISPSSCDRSFSFDSTDSEKTLSSPKSRSSSSSFSDESDSCVLCKLAFANDGDEERKILNSINGCEKCGHGHKDDEHNLTGSQAKDHEPDAALLSNWKHNVKEQCALLVTNLVPFVTQQPHSPDRQIHIEVNDIDFEEVTEMFRSVNDIPIRRASLTTHGGLVYRGVSPDTDAMMKNTASIVNACDNASNTSRKRRTMGMVNTTSDCPNGAHKHPRYVRTVF
jgi:hypothetical protein